MGLRAKVLFLCTGNSCRSQMAEGWTNFLKSKDFEAHSAGTHPKGLDPYALQVMQEAGVNLTGARSKGIEDFSNTFFDYVVTVCDDACESCPVFSRGTVILHRSFEDPFLNAAAADNEDDRLVAYRRVRDEIRLFIESLEDALANAIPLAAVAR